jgi:hypothetical protein
MKNTEITKSSEDSFWCKVNKTLNYHRNRATQTMRGYWWDFKHKMPDRPVFIVGCSRAGTTLVYKTFSESLELGSLQKETHDFWADLHPLDERNWDSHGLQANQANDNDRNKVARYFYSYTGQDRFVDKNNQNGLCVSYLHALFPDARFVYVKRSPGDNINSLIEGWRRPGEFDTWSERFPEKVAVENGEFEHWNFFLSEGWREYLASSIEEVCAFQYRSMNEAIISSRAEIPTSQWTEIRYEDLLINPVAGFSNAFQECGLSFTDDLRQHCSNVLKIPYNAFSEIRLDKWKDGRNKEKIERILSSVAEVAEKMGYRDIT